MLFKQISAILLTAIMTITFTACGNKSTTDRMAEITYGEYIWPTIGLASVLPVPESKIGEIITNESTDFYIDVDKTSVEQFESYLKKCVEAGFVFDYSEYNGSSYEFHSEEYDLTVFYNKRDSLMSIIISKTKDE